jgi:hypothetical protein
MLKCVTTLEQTSRLSKRNARCRCTAYPLLLREDGQTRVTLHLSCLVCTISLCFAGAESRQAFDFSEEAIRLMGHKQGFAGISYDELVAQYSQAVAAASSAAFNQSKLARKVCCSSLNFQYGHCINGHG